MRKFWAIAGQIYSAAGAVVGFLALVVFGIFFVAHDYVFLGLLLFLVGPLWMAFCLRMVDRFMDAEQ